MPSLPHSVPLSCLGLTQTAARSCELPPRWCGGERPATIGAEFQFPEVLPGNYMGTSNRRE